MFICSVFSSSFLFTHTSTKQVIRLVFFLNKTLPCLSSIWRILQNYSAALNRIRRCLPIVHWPVHASFISPSECSALCLNDIWLGEHVPNSSLYLPGFQLQYRAFSKSEGRRNHFHINCFHIRFNLQIGFRPNSKTEPKEIS